ncbi:DUF2892 domain-containing protein [Actinocrinis puniceicyclus]|uniref:DUF2892 domain-containing protein n=1 Tax=Actinocrinis puniceicyclus TaxID=977794 RepID=A0A8J7WPW4_9ACTN|nr:YgaP-like transmembrane domain [Actinocrinis puniceicyclus]MBS2966328.1 DUF2892 domain-containing protein [Actinocrinis puniceicyclus]
MEFFAFLASRAGRITRGVAGVALIVAGVALGGGWWALAVVGLAPLAAATFDFCLFAPLAHLPLGGPSLRAKLHAH